MVRVRVRTAALVIWIRGCSEFRCFDVDAIDLDAIEMGLGLECGGCGLERGPFHQCILSSSDSCTTSDRDR